MSTPTTPFVAFAMTKAITFATGLSAYRVTITFEKLFDRLAGSGVRFVQVGGQAVTLHGYV
jgi:hypothetical protein